MKNNFDEFVFVFGFGTFNNLSSPPCILLLLRPVDDAEAASRFSMKTLVDFQAWNKRSLVRAQDLLRELDVHSRRRQYVSRQSVDKEFPENRDQNHRFISSRNAKMVSLEFHIV